MSGDKIIRIGLDDKKVGEANDRIAKNFENTQKRLNEISKSNLKVSKEELADLEKKIQLYRELSKLKEDSQKKEISDRQLDLEKQQIRYKQWKRQREETSEGLSGTAKLDYDRYTRTASGLRSGSIDRQKADLLDRKREFQETRETNKKQLQETTKIIDTIKGESNKGIRNNEMNINRLVSGGVGMMRSGNIGGAVSGLGMLGGGVGLAAFAIGALLNETGNYQENLKKFSVATQLPIPISNLMATGFRKTSMGLNQEEAMAKYAMMAGSSGRLLGTGEFYGLSGTQISRGFSDQQINQLLSISRYTSNSPLGTINALEQYVSQRDKGSLIKLPELMDHYLKVANEILNRTGKVDAISLQQSMMSIGSSYGVQGLQLERMTSGLTGLAGGNQNGIMKAMQMETLRSMYPSMSTWEMQKIMENPTANPEYMKEFTNRMSKFGGGGDWTKFMLLNQSNLSTSEIEKVVNGQFNVSARPTDSGGKATQDKYIAESENFVGAVEKITTAIGTIKDIILQTSSGITEDIVNLFNIGGKMEQSMKKAIKDANKESSNYIYP